MVILMELRIDYQGIDLAGLVKLAKYILYCRVISLILQNGILEKTNRILSYYVFSLQQYTTHDFN